MSFLQTDLRLRQGTAAAWTLANPVLALAEPGWESDTTRWKVGDGVTVWASLPYVQTTASTAKVAAAALAAGQAVRPNPSGQLVLARGDATNNAKGTRLAATGAAISFAAPLAQNFLTLNDWTADTGSTLLTASTDYFLSTTTAGLLTATIPTTGVLLHIGTALDTITMALSGADPITL